MQEEQNAVGTEKMGRKALDRDEVEAVFQELHEKGLLPDSLTKSTADTRRYAPKNFLPRAVPPVPADPTDAIKTSSASQPQRGVKKGSKKGKMNNLLLDS